MADHPFTKLWDQIAVLAIAAQEKAVLWSLARHSHWDDGTGAWPSERTIADETGLSARQVRRYLSSLRCSPTLPCQGDNDCRHRGLIVVQRPPTHHKPTMYALDLSEFAFQMHLPEVGQTGHVGQSREDADGAKGGRVG